MESNKAFTAVIDFNKSKVNGKNTQEIVIAMRDVAGYMRQSQFGRIFPGLNAILIKELVDFPEAEVEKWIDELNRKHFGLNPEQAFNIVMSSIKAQNARNS